MKFLHRFIKLGAYLALLSGLVVAIALFSFAIYFWFIYPSSVSQASRVATALVIIIVAVATLIISVALFETIIETIKIENKLGIDQEAKKDE